MEKRNVPKLRFNGFEDAWKSEKLGNFLEFKNGINADKEAYGKGVKFINVLDILNNNSISYENIIGLVDIDAKTLVKYSVNYGDILFQRSSETREEVGTANVYLGKEPVTFGGFVIRGKKIAEYSPKFMNSLLKSSSSRKEVVTKSGGSTRYNVGQEILSDVNIILPSLEEQTKIANFLSNVDKIIEEQDGKVKDLEQYKKGMMQKIFKRKIRFKDENGQEYPEWRTQDLGENIHIIKGQQLNKENFISKGEYYVLNGGINPSGYTDKYNVSENRISISEGGNSCGFVNYNIEKFWSGGHCYTLELKNSNVYGRYIYEILKYKEKHIMNLRVGTGLPNIQKSDLNKFKIEIPIIEEQIKIAEFLYNIDNIIEQENKKLQDLKTWKKGLLQQMFV